MAGLLYTRRTRILLARTLFEVSQQFGKSCTVVEIGMGVRRKLAVWRHGPLFSHVFTWVHMLIYEHAIDFLDRRTKCTITYAWFILSIDKIVRIAHLSLSRRLQSTLACEADKGQRSGTGQLAHLR